MTHSSLTIRVKTAVSAASALAANPSIRFAEDKATDDFCRHYFCHMLTEAQLHEKVSQELMRGVWQPLGRLLLIVSEKDSIGTTLAFLAAYITGNKLIIKARQSLPLLHCLKQQLALNDDEAQIIDWQNSTQNDKALLAPVQAVLLAGGADLINHFRHVTPHPIRLIEFGPKISAIAIGSAVSDIAMPNLIDQLIYEVSLFLQEVCSAPQFILVESLDLAQQLYSALTAKLTELPNLPSTVCLLQSTKFAELKLIKQLQNDLLAVSFNADNGWGVTLSTTFDPSLWLTKGFQLVVGDIDQHIQAAQHHWLDKLQTLGITGEPTLSFTGFTRFCPLGTMHQRPLTAPHDGFFELGALVSFISREVL